MEIHLLEDIQIGFWNYLIENIDDNDNFLLFPDFLSSLIKNLNTMKYYEILCIVKYHTHMIITGFMKSKKRNIYSFTVDI